MTALDPLPNLYAVLRALTAPDDGDEHPFLRDAARLERVYLNPLGVAARHDGVRAQWSTTNGFEAIEILTARDLWPLASVDLTIARLNRIRAKPPTIAEVLSIAAQGTAALQAVETLRSQRGPKGRTVTLFESTAWYGDDLVPFKAKKARSRARIDPMGDDAINDIGERVCGLFFSMGYAARHSFETLLYPCLLQYGTSAGRTIAQSLRWQLERRTA